MTLAEQLQAQAAKLKKVDDNPPPVSKPESQMTLAEQLQAASARLKKPEETKPVPKAPMTL